MYVYIMRLMRLKALLVYFCIRVEVEVKGVYIICICRNSDTQKYCVFSSQNVLTKKLVHGTLVIFLFRSILS